MLNKEKSLIYDFQFRMPEMSSRLEGLWWFYDEHTDGFIAVENTSDDVVTATPTFYAQQHPRQLEPLHLQPHEMRLIELRKELNELQLEGTTGGGVTIESSKPNAVIAGGGLVNPEIGFTAPLRMDDPEMQAMRTSRLGRTLYALMVSIGEDSSMMGMGLPPGTLMNPIVNLRNVTDGNIGVKLVFRYQAGSSTQSFTIPTMQLGAQEIRRVNLLSYWQSGQIPQTVSSGSVELSYTGRPGSLVAGVTSVDQTGTFVFDAKIDNRLSAGFQGEYWSTEGDNNTAFTIKNITQKEAKAWPSFQYDSGRSNYEMQPMTLQPGESQMIDLKMLQVEKVPGVNGEVLPVAITFGGMKLREEPGGRHFLIDAVVFNPKTATCGVCGYGCLYPQSLVTIPTVITVVMGHVSDALGVQANMCDGTTELGWECQCDFNSVNSSTATVSEFCANYVTGVNSGSTFANGTAAGIPGPLCGEQTLIARGNVQVRCGDERDTIIAEYPQYGVSFTPTCADFTQTGHSTHFSFAELNSGDYSWAIIRNSLLTGLECVRAGNGNVALTINSGYRNPAHNAAVGGESQSRHMFGDAANIASNTQTWDPLHDAGKSCGACVEPRSATFPGHVHVDWRGTCPQGW